MTTSHHPIAFGQEFTITYADARGNLIGLTQVDGMDGRTDPRRQRRDDEELRSKRRSCYWTLLSTKER